MVWSPDHFNDHKYQSFTKNTCKVMLTALTLLPAAFCVFLSYGEGGGGGGRVSHASENNFEIV